MSIRNVPAILAAAMFVAVSFPANAQQSREVIEEFVKQNQAQLWIQHDYTSGIKRKIAPAFYD
jgi:ABC-type iron transport system FetAB ATPase subunit